MHWTRGTLATTACSVLLLTSSRLITASDAIWIQPSGQWYGIDGTWSSFSFGVGSPMQMVQLTVSTTLSEIWVVSTGGCSPNPLCSAARGGVFNKSASTDWSALGAYELGLSYLNQGGNGDYGFDSMAFTNTLTQTTTTVTGALIAAINDTDYYEGFLGIGANTVGFGSNLTNSLLSQLAQEYGSIPSHSYGYTAGAYYTGAGNGTVGSLVLGGYDALRFVPHDTVFNLNPNVRVPTVRLRGVTAAVSSVDQAPTPWTTPIQSLVTMSDNLTVIIDTTTPYLWLPPAICDRFAAAFNLTWNDDFGVYLFPDGDQYTKFKNDKSLSITFSVSSYDNGDNFGQPLNVPGVVNITVAPAAFAQTLRYPFKDMISYGQPGVPYFPLKRTNSSQLVIGRVFMQEAYIQMNYDEDLFSVHQALFPDNAAANISVQSFTRPTDSAYPPYSGSTQSKGLSIGQTVGIVIGAFVTGSVVGLLIWLCCRRRRNANHANEIDPDKEDTESVEDELPRSPVRRMFSLIIGRKRSRRPVASEVHGDSAQPTEVGADSSHELYELPVPPEPAELDSMNDPGDQATDLVTGGTEGLSEYELQRRRIERQLQGPVPAYTPPPREPEKTAQDISPVPHYRPSEEPSPTSTPSYGFNTNSLPDFLPSPISPNPGDGTRRFDFPSPLAVIPPVPSPISPKFPSTNSEPNAGSYPLPSPSSPSSANFTQSGQPTFEPTLVSRSDSSNVSPTSPVKPNLPKMPPVQRTPIDPSKVVYLGPLPESVQLQLARQASSSVPIIITPDGRTVAPNSRDSSPHHAPSPLTSPPTSPGRVRRGSADSLGSNFTVDEAGRFEDEVEPHHSVRQAEGQGARRPHTIQRIEAHSELVHVPQVAEKRYSWEDDRTS